MNYVLLCMCTVYGWAIWLRAHIPASGYKNEPKFKSFRIPNFIFAMIELERKNQNEKRRFWHLIWAEAMVAPILHIRKLIENWPNVMRTAIVCCCCSVSLIPTRKIERLRAKRSSEQFNFVFFISDFAFCGKVRCSISLHSIIFGIYVFVCFETNKINK